MAAAQQQKAEEFRAMHNGETFVIPNPWDAGSARVLEALGFKALATSSAGFAFTLGRLDGDVTLDEMADHAGALDRATALPVSVDLENGYGPGPEDAANAITHVAAAGAVGGSIEDWDPDRRVIYDLDHAVERVAAAARAATSLDLPFTLTARAENFFRHRDDPDLDDTIARLQAFGRAGADVLYAPGLRNPEEIAAVCDAVDKPVNVLAFAQLEMSLQDFADAGARRISVGSLLSLVSVDAMAKAAERIRDDGDFSALAAHPPIKRWLS
ncbi:MAG TPA: isocitrate lyase/phosphoenolpyruvate mutase family protein [Solirubrobacterales bacterium]|nr:isocitrate lyase/phosphoenolpyruvate mutase family protein [Solirubrobacterales bacterium]